MASGTLTPLNQAGHREREWARTLHKRGTFPADFSVGDVLAYGMYDAHTDEIVLMFGGVSHRYKVDRP